MATNSILTRQYTVSQLLGSRVSIVIPDIQRDYCWGEPSQLVEPLEPMSKAYSFVAGIMRLYKHRRAASMGLLYGYSPDHSQSSLHIIDGMHRITTVFLLLGMLYRRVPSDRLRSMLISDYELLDDRHPTLLYQSKREAFYFLSDLVTRFFLDRDGRLSQLERSDWYYDSYDSDPSVHNFILAIRDIDELLEEELHRNPALDFADMADFVADELSFIYCGLPSQQYAEREFVILNTTGEPLNLEQNLRALSIAQEKANGKDPLEVAAAWNKIESWFWRCKLGSTVSFENFYSLYLKYCSEGNYAFGLFCQVFDAYSALLDTVSQHGDSADLACANCNFAILPAIEYALKFDADPYDIYHFFANITRYMRPSAADADNAMLLVRSMRHRSILSLAHNAPERGKIQGISRILNEEEVAKLSFMAAQPEANAIVRRAEQHPMLNGRASKLISWSKGNMAVFAHYVDAIYAIWPGDINNAAGLDLVRRALLTLRHPDYPIVRRGNTIMTLCWHDYDWQRLMQLAPGVVRQLIDRIYPGAIADGMQADYSEEHVRKCLQGIVDKFDDPDCPYLFIIKDSHILRKCRNRALQRPDSRRIGYYDLSRQTTVWR